MRPTSSTIPSLATLQLVTAEAGAHPLAPPLPHAAALWHVCRAGRVREIEGFLRHYGTALLGTRIDQLGNTPLGRRLTQTFRCLSNILFIIIQKFGN